MLYDNHNEKWHQAMKCTAKSGTNKSNVTVCTDSVTEAESETQGVIYRGCNSGGKLNAVSLIIDLWLQKKKRYKRRMICESCLYINAEWLNDMVATLPNV